MYKSKGATIYMINIIWVSVYERVVQNLHIEKLVIPAAVLDSPQKPLHLSYHLIISS